MAFFRCKSLGSPPEPQHNYLYKWDFTKSLVDEVNNIEFGIYGGATQDSNGITFSGSNQYGKVLTPILMNGKTIELDVASFDASDETHNISIIMNASYVNPYYNTGSLRWSSNNNYWGAFLYDNMANFNRTWSKWADALSKTFFNGKTIKICYEIENKLTLFVDDNLIGIIQNSYSYHSRYDDAHPKYREDGLFIGGFGDSNADGNYFYNVVITGLRIYDNRYNLEWDLTESLVDKNEGKAITLTGNNVVQNPNGLTITGSDSYATIPFSFGIDNNIIYEFDISSMSKSFNNSNHGRFIMPTTTNGFIWRYQTQQWAIYDNATWYEDTSGSSYVSNPNIFSGKTMKMLYDDNNKLCVYADDILIYRCSKTNALQNLSDTFAIGGSYGSGGYYDLTITGIRIHKKEA